jgi:hypothetical protein
VKEVEEEEGGREREQTEQGGKQNAKAVKNFNC